MVMMTQATKELKKEMSEQGNQSDAVDNEVLPKVRRTPLEDAFGKSVKVAANGKN
jgi:hypothetical protein